MQPEYIDPKKMNKTLGVAKPNPRKTKLAKPIGGEPLFVPK